jgi:hypothetical protein
VAGISLFKADEVARVSVLLLMLVSLLASCGSDKSGESRSDDRGATRTSGSSAPQGTTAAAEDQPTGSLSPKEYELVHTAFSKIKQADKLKSPKKALLRFRAACDGLRPPPTPLIEASYDDCVSTAQFFDEIIAFPEKITACGGEGPRQEISTSSCMSRPIQAIVTRSRTAVENAKATNHALEQRQIGGRCYRVMGTSKRDLRNVSGIAITADRFDEALQAGDPRRATRATNEFQAALERYTNNPSGNLLKLLRACQKP